MEFIKSKGLSQRKFERIIGVSNGFVNNISKGIGAEKLQRILREFPELNSDWLLNGYGEMILPGVHTQHIGHIFGNAQGVNVTGNVTIATEKDSPVILKERIKHLEELLAEKERLINVLMEGRK